MNASELVAKMGEKQAWLPGKKIKLDFGADGKIMLDGVNNQVSQDDGDADTTIKVSLSDLSDMNDGKLDGMTAFMQGKLQVEGDMSNAMQMQGVFAKLKS